MRHVYALAFVLALTACGASAGPGPAPADDAGPGSETGVPALSGSVQWADGCLMNACLGASHRVTVGAPMNVASCRMTGNAVTLEVAVIAVDGQSFDESREGLRLSGTVASERLTGGQIVVRGNGWQATGPVSGGACEVTASLDYTQRRVRGAVTCSGLRDDATPPNARTIMGTFDVTGCSP